MIKKYSTADIGSIYKVSDKKNLTCIKCNSEIELNGEIGIDNLISLENEDPTICKKCRELEKGE